ncbi:hypothetical protein GOBAR_AA36092 [Gossypium barbadense]|uniref:Uncharacterized protein n=1 Tax=Gossypium barbadense TaxID=3634 RepID=A0A2P5W0L6_GOSBA|nr:hypothetical protein GOBAR_AA36092 [Gossypium barbadense]
MKLPHELDKRVVVAELVGPRAVGGHHQECPRRPPPRGVKEPEVSCQLSHVGANGDGPLPMPLRLVLNREGDEIGKVDDVPEAALGAKVCQHFKGEKCMWRLRVSKSFSSLNSSVYKPSAAPNSRTLSWWINPPRQN